MDNSEALRLIEEHDLFSLYHDAVEMTGSNDLVAYFDESDPDEMYFMDRREFLADVEEEGQTPFEPMRQSAMAALGPTSLSQVAMWVIITTKDGDLTCLTVGGAAPGKFSPKGQFMCKGGDA